MKILIVNNASPFIYGGAEFLEDSLQKKLEEYGHSVQLIKIPFSWSTPEAVLDQILAMRLIKIENADRVIALKFPAYFIPHNNKVLWLIHQFRQVYDLWGTEYGSFPDDKSGKTTRDQIRHADDIYIPESKKIYAISKVTSDRLKKYNNIQSEILNPPLIDERLYRFQSYGDYIYYPSRINNSKRQWLAVEAMQYTKSGVKLLITGSPDTKDDLIKLRKSVEKKGVGEKVQIIDHYISQKEKAKYYSECLACAYLPYDEDYGYVTLEAFQCRKSVITLTDSGGTHDLVENGKNGYIVNPNPEDIAQKFDHLFENKLVTREMGNAAFNTIEEKQIRWAKVINKLTE